MNSIQNTNNNPTLLYDSMQDIYGDCMFNYFTMNVNPLFTDIFNSFFKRTLQYFINKTDLNEKDLSFLKKEINLIAKSIITNVTIGGNEDRAEEIAKNYFNTLKTRYVNYEEIFSVVKDLSLLNQGIPKIDNSDNNNNLPPTKNKNKI